MGSRLSPNLLDEHNHVCDLINVQAAVLSLYSDGKRNWIYLWCDTDNSGTNRWMLFSASRKSLVEYLKGGTTLLKVLKKSAPYLILDKTRTAVETQPDGSRHIKYRRTLTSFTDLEQVERYLPTPESYFDPELTEDIELEQQLAPDLYEVPIRGVWFSEDFEALFRSYERVYALIYATKPRFVRTIGDRLGSLLRAPWTGGFSRVHMYSQLARHLPAIHTLKIDKLKFASPGEVKFEALEAVGDSIKEAVLKFVDHEEDIWHHVKAAKALLTRKKLNKSDLSDVNDAGTGLLRDELRFLKTECDQIADILGVKEEFETLRSYSPNVVVYCKAVNSFVKQLSRLAKFQQDAMLNLRRLPEEQFENLEEHD